MAFWWVNHRQTFKEEIGGGYIWSPKENNDGSRNQTYLNLAIIKVGDVIFSYANAEIKAVGVIEREFSESDRPAAFGSSGEQWDKNGWLVEVNWTVLAVPFRPKDYLETIVPLLPDKYSPIQSSGDGNQKFYLAAINDQLGKLLFSISKNHNLGIDDLVEETEQSVLDNIAESEIKERLIPKTEREQLIKARRGQGIFRYELEKIERSVV